MRGELGIKRQSQGDGRDRHDRQLLWGKSWGWASSEHVQGMMGLLCGWRVGAPSVQFENFLERSPEDTTMDTECHDEQEAEAKDLGS